MSREPRVAVYFDFDNIIISRYDQLNGRQAFRRDFPGAGRDPITPEVRDRLRAANVSIDAVLDYAATFGALAVCRAYADWSHPVNASYRDDLTARAADLVQMFPLSVRRKNGADIRLAVDAMEDLFLLDDVTHVVIVAGDSDFVPLVQKTRRMGRYVVGIGVAGGTSRILSGACDEYADYDALLTDEDSEIEEPEPAQPAVPTVSPERTVPPASSDAPAEAPAQGQGASSRRASSPPSAQVSAPVDALTTAEPADLTDVDSESGLPNPGHRRRPGPLLRKALLLLETKTDEQWQMASTVKNQMLRMDPSFQERELGFASFTEFVKAYPGVVEIDTSGPNRIRRRPGAH